MGKRSKQTIGYKYFMGLHMVICHGPVDNISRIDVGEKPAYYGNITGNTQIYIDQPGLFGGEDKEGGIQGAVDVMFGGDTQPKNGYLVSQLGAVIPAFRGVVSFVLNRCYVAAMSPYPKPWSFLTTRIPGQGWFPGTANIGGGSANAAHIIYDCFTNPEWGMGYAPSVIDDASFRACAQVLFNEGLGLSFILSNADSMENFIQEVCKHVAAAVSTDLTTGKFVMKLLRDDYVVSGLKLYDESNILSLESYEKPSPAEMINEVVVRFKPRGTGTDDSVTVQDLASIQNQQGIISKEVSYPGIDNATNAARVAGRELRTSSTPLTRVKIKCNRTAWNEKIGGCIRFSWADKRVANMVLRIININFGKLDASEIMISAVEDVFGLPSASYVAPQPPLWVDPIQPPTQLTNRFLSEATYWDIKNNMSNADIAALTNFSSFMTGAAAQPAQATPNFEFWTRTSGGAYEYAQAAPYAPMFVTGGVANRTQTTIAIGSSRGNINFVDVGTYARWGDELVRYDAFNAGTGVLTIGRGVLDSVASEHASTTPIVFLEDFQAVDKREYASGESAYGKMLMRTSNALYPLGSAAEDGITFAGRYARPYVPGRFTVTGVIRPNEVYEYFGEAPSLGWSHRDRTAQLATLIDQTIGNIGPEAGVAYTLRVREWPSTAVLRTEAMAAATGYDYTVANNRTDGVKQKLKIELWSVRAGLSSYTTQTQILNRHGFGYNYGGDYGGVPA